MADYLKDEQDREARRRKKEFAEDLIKHEKQSVTLGIDEEPWTAVGVEIRDEDFMRIAREAHARDITINKMVNIILRDGIKNAQYRYEHDTKPQFLTESE